MGKPDTSITTTMVEVRKYYLKPTPLIPNSPYPLLHYPGILRNLVTKPDFNGSHIDDVFRSNGWHTQWIIRYDNTQGSHYHSHAHECMVVISGQGAKIRFGAADLSDNLDESTYGDKYEKGSEVVLEARQGDVFVIPAGVAHKTHAVVPKSPGLRFMSSESGHLSEEDVEAARERLKDVVVDEYFMMCGAYPMGQDWDWKAGGEKDVKFEDVWSVKLPEKDPVLGEQQEGLRGLWRRSEEGVRESESKL